MRFFHAPVSVRRRGSGELVPSDAVCISLFVIWLKCWQFSEIQLQNRGSSCGATWTYCYLVAIEVVMLLKCVFPVEWLVNTEMICWPPFASRKALERINEGDSFKIVIICRWSASVLPLPSLVVAIRLLFTERFPRQRRDLNETHNTDGRSPLWILELSLALL